MKIIIAGAGKIGSTLAKILAGEGHDVSIIEKDPATVYQISNVLDVMCYEGSATNSETLSEAGAAEADLVIAATEKDEVNMICGISARKLGTGHVIARIRDTEYLEQREFLQDALGLSVIINPELECAKEISRILRFPGAARVETFAKSTAEVVEFKIKEGSRADGLQLRQLSQTFKSKVLVCAVERDNEAIIPKGDFTIKNGDRLSVIGSAKEQRKFFAALGEYRKPVKSAIIMGGGRIGVYLTRLLQENGIDVSLIEMDRSRCEELTDLLPNAHIVCGDATKSAILAEEDIDRADSFIALTGDDGDNIITSIYAASRGVEKIVTKVNREHYANMLDSSPLDCLVTPKNVIAQQIARYVRALDDSSRGSRIETLYRLADGQAEALEFEVNADSGYVGKELKNLKLKGNVLIAAIIRGTKTIIPDGSSVIQPGDHAIVVTTAGWLKRLDDTLEVNG